MLLPQLHEGSTYLHCFRKVIPASPCLSLRWAQIFVCLQLRSLRTRAAQSVCSLRPALLFHPDSTAAVIKSLATRTIAAMEK